MTSPFLCNPPGLALGLELCIGVGGQQIGLAGAWLL